MFQTVVRATREITQGSDRARVWLGGVALAPHRPSAQKGGPEEVVSRRSEGRVFRGREWQAAEAARSEEWAVVLCDLIHLLQRSLCPHLENGLAGGRSRRARGLLRLRCEERESLGRNAVAGWGPFTGAFI